MALPLKTVTHKAIAFHHASLHLSTDMGTDSVHEIQGSSKYQVATRGSTHEVTEN